MYFTAVACIIYSLGTDPTRRRGRRESPRHARQENRSGQAEFYGKNFIKKRRAGLTEGGVGASDRGVGESAEEAGGIGRDNFGSEVVSQGVEESFFGEGG